MRFIKAFVTYIITPIYITINAKKSKLLILSKHNELAKYIIEYNDKNRNYNFSN